MGTYTILFYRGIWPIEASSSISARGYVNLLLRGCLILSFVND